MAIFPTKLQDAIVNVPSSDAFKSFEGRGSVYDVARAFIDNTERLVPKQILEGAKKSSAHVAKIPVLKKLDPTGVITTARSCDPSDTSVDSAFVSPTYGTYSFSFHMTPSWNEVNYISFQEEFAWKFMQHLQAFYAELDSDLVAYLDSNASLVNASALFGGINTGVVTVPLADKEDFYKSIPSIMFRNDLSAQRVIDIANPESQIMYDSIARQGAGNAVNTEYQISNFAPYRSNRVVLDTDMVETHYLIPEGNVGLLEWLPWEYRANKMLNDTDLWTTVADPMYGLTWGLRYKAKCADLSAVVGGIADQTNAYVDMYEFSIDLAPFHSYSSDTSSPIYKYQIGTVTP